MNNEEKQIEEVKGNDFEKSVIDLLIQYLLNKSDDEERKEFGEILVKVIQANIADIEISYERKKIKDDLVANLKQATDHADLVTEDIKKEHAEMMRQSS